MTKATVTTGAGTININDVNIGSEIRLYTADGAMLQNLTAADNHIEITVPMPGIYLLTFDSKTFKIAVK